MMCKCVRYTYELQSRIRRRTYRRGKKCRLVISEDSDLFFPSLHYESNNDMYRADGVDGPQEMEKK